MAGRPEVTDETGIQVVPCASVVDVQAQSHIVHLCPFKNEVDEGEVEVSWTTAGGMTLELHSLAAYLRGFEGTLISHEDLVEKIRYDLSELPVWNVSVRGMFNTAHMAVVVAAG